MGEYSSICDELLSIYEMIIVHDYKEVEFLTKQLFKDDINDLRRVNNFIGDLVDKFYSYLFDFDEQRVEKISGDLIKKWSQKVLTSK